MTNEQGDITRKQPSTPLSIPDFVHHDLTQLTQDSNIQKITHHLT